MEPPRASYLPADLEAALAGRTLLELRAMIRPATDLALCRADMASWDDGLDRQGWRKIPARLGVGQRRVLSDILARLAESGALPSRDLPDTCQVPWSSTGWTNNRNVPQLLEFMVRRWEVRSTGNGSKGDRWYAWAWLGTASPCHHLLINPPWACVSGGKPGQAYFPLLVRRRQRGRPWRRPRLLAG